MNASELQECKGNEINARRDTSELQKCSGMNIDG